MRIGVVLLAILVSGCGGPGAPASRNGAPAADQSAARPASPRTLVIAFRFESADLSWNIRDTVASGQKELFNAALSGKDHGGVPQAWLAEALPKLNTDAWRVFPDGTMETTHRLRPNLTWHDGQPLTAADFVFAWQVKADPGLGAFEAAPQSLTEEISAPDSRTIVIRWRQPYADADILDRFFTPMPRHVLGDPLAEYQQGASSRENFLGLAAWTTQYVGLGPYRLERWEPGIALNGVAFDGYVFGRPKIDRIVARIIFDQNVSVTNLLAGEVQFAAPQALNFPQLMVAKRQWDPSGAGVVEFYGGAPTSAIVQFRPEYQRTPALFDVRVRRALNSAIDRQALQDGLFEGLGEIAWTHADPAEPYFAEANRAVTRYPYDPRRTEALMNEAGFFKNTEGVFATPAGERFRPDFQVLEGAVFELHGAIMQDTWMRAGIPTEFSVLSNLQSRDPVNRNTFTGIGGAGSPGFLRADQVGTPQNRWFGDNRGGWVNPDMEALWTAYDLSLDRTERERLQVAMFKRASEEVPVFVLYRNTQGFAHPTALRGPRLPNHWWSIHTWELQ